MNEMAKLSRCLASLLALICASQLYGCEKLMQDMYDQPRYKPLAKSDQWQDQASARPPEADTVPYSGGATADTSSGRLQVKVPTPAIPPATEPAGVGAGNDAATWGDHPPANPLPVTAANLARGRERYDIYCLPCHSAVGDGDGIVVRRGFPRPPSLHIDRLRAAPDAYFYSVITHGIGVMYPHADRIEPEDRWAIALYIRALQLSQHATLADATPAGRAQLERTAP
jgi:mono/diheme cytochrome c family protein